MGCTSCGTDAKLIELMFNKLMHEALDDGTLQAGLVSCSDRKLEKNTGVVICTELHDKVCELIESGELCIVSPTALSATPNKQDPTFTDISLIMSDGSTLTTKIKTGGISETRVKELIKMSTDPLEDEIEELKRRLSSIPNHNAGIKLVDGTGDIELANAHETEDM